MCISEDTQLPIYGPPRTATKSNPFVLTSTDGAQYAAFLATPEKASGIGIVVLPDNRGLSSFYEKLAVQLAEQGHTSVAIDYFGRTDGIGRNRGSDFPLMQHLFKLTRDGLYADIQTAGDLLRSSCRAVVTLGFCMGGRLAFLASSPQFRFSGVIGLYGMPDPVNGAPGPAQLADQLEAPILGLFGGADENIPPAMVNNFDKTLSAAGVKHEFVVYPGAPHSFFDLKYSEYAEACADAWRRILAFIDEQMNTLA